MNEKEFELECINDLKKIKEIIRQNQNKAMVYVNSQMVYVNSQMVYVNSQMVYVNSQMVYVNSQMILTYYEIGTIINERKYWGSKYIQNLANNLKEYGNSYSIRNLHYMAQFAAEFSLYEISSQHVSQIPWGTLMTVIVPKSKSHEEMLYYINETYKNGWSRSMVLNQIAMKSYERSLIEPELNEIINSDESLNELGPGFFS